MHLDAAFDGGFWHLDEQNPNYQIGESSTLSRSVVINGMGVIFAEFSRCIYMKVPPYILKTT